MTFSIDQFGVGPMQNFCYFVIDQASKEVLVVDPAWEPEKIIGRCEKKGLILKGILVTHAHYDHSNGIEPLLKKFDIPVYAHGDEIKYAQAGHSIVGQLGNSVKPLKGNDTLALGETKIEFLHTPGHTPGSQCIQIGDKLITGDTLFIGGCGRSDMPGGDATLLFRSLKKIASLDGHIEILPGHDYGDVPKRQLNDEMKHNPYLTMGSEQTFIETVG